MLLFLNFGGFYGMLWYSTIIRFVTIIVAFVAFNFVIFQCREQVIVYVLLIIIVLAVLITIS
jgi:hypothetical protein